MKNMDIYKAIQTHGLKNKYYPIILKAIDRGIIKSRDMYLAIQAYDNICEKSNQDYFNKLEERIK